MLRDASFGSSTSVSTSTQRDIGSSVVLHMAPWVIGIGVVGAATVKDENLRVRFGTVAAIGAVMYLGSYATGA